MVYYFCQCMSLTYVLVKSFILDSRLANCLERYCPFGFLLEVFDCGGVWKRNFPFGIFLVMF